MSSRTMIASVLRSLSTGSTCSRRSCNAVSASSPSRPLNCSTGWCMSRCPIRFPASWAAAVSKSSWPSKKCRTDPILRSASAATFLRVSPSRPSATINRNAASMTCWRRSSASMRAGMCFHPRFLLTDSSHAGWSVSYVCPSLVNTKNRSKSRANQRSWVTARSVPA